MKLFNQAVKCGRTVSMAVGATALTTGVAFAAGTDVDYSSIVAGVAVTGVITGIVAMGAVKIGPNVARWAANKLANFF